MPRLLRFRLILLSVCVVCSAVAIGVRLYELQIANHDRFTARATEQHEGRFSIPARRGSLLDRHGDSLAVSLERRSLYAHPRRVDDPDRAAALLAPLLAVSKGELATRLREDRSFVYLGRFLDPEVARRIEDLGRSSDDDARRLSVGPGHALDFEREARRAYPRGHIGSHVVGFADVDGVGRAGAENRFDEILQGAPSIYLVLKDARQGLRRQLVVPPDKESSNVRLTIDLALQHLVERELDAAMRSTGARGATALILDPATGQVLALANRPTIDRERPSRGQRSDARANRAIEHQFEPGSTFKIVPMALALEHGTLRLGEKIYCHDGSYTTGYGRTIRDVGKNGMLAPREILAKSSNIGMVLLNRRIDSETLYEGIRRFGFGTRTGIELPAEAPGSLASVSSWSAFTHDSLAFGQEIGATALQIASAMATIANDGVRVEPRVGLGREDAHGALVPFEPGVETRVVSAGTARAVAEMLEEVVETGSGKAARLPGYRVAGKSGTAQKAAGAKGYSETDFIASFVGFAPASDPALVVLVALDTPRGTRRQGGEVAAPVFGRILAEALQYLRVPRDAEPPLLAAHGGTAAEHVAFGVRDAPRVESGVVPDVRDRTLREAVKTLSAQGYRVRVDGGGVVFAQSPPPGTSLAAGGVCELWAAPAGKLAGKGTTSGGAG